MIVPGRRVVPITAAHDLRPDFWNPTPSRYSPGSLKPLVRHHGRVLEPDGVPPARHPERATAPHPTVGKIPTRHCGVDHQEARRLVNVRLVARAVARRPLPRSVTGPRAWSGSPRRGG